MSTLLLTLHTDFAQVVPNPIDLWPTLLSWGPPAAVLGLVLWAVYTSKFFTKAEVARMEANYLARIEEWRDRYNKQVEETETWKDHSMRQTDNLERLTNGLHPVHLPTPAKSGNRGVRKSPEHSTEQEKGR